MRLWKKGPAVLLLFILFSLSGFVTAQTFSYVPYYGKNKVQYAKFHWKSYAVEHFKIFYYANNIRTLKDVAEIAESAYQRTSRLFKHQLSIPVPLIFYSTYTDFEQTNLFQISEGVLGVSEPVLHRIAVHGDMPLDELQSLMEHELTHIFQFDILWGHQGTSLYAVSQPPLWIFEGLSEYTTQKWSSWSSLIVRDAVLNDRIPDLTDSGELLSRYPLPREPAYDFGHAIYDFIESKFGGNAIRELWQSLKNSPLIGKREPIKRTFNIKPKEFYHEFKKYLRDRFKDFLGRENPENYSLTLGPEFPTNTYYFTFSHALSPSGDLVAALTFNTRDYDIDIVLVSTKDGSIVRNMTKGYTNKYDHIKFEVDPAGGRNIAWSQDGDRIAFLARDGEKHSLFIISALTGKTLRKFKINLDQPNSPSFVPSSDEMLFSAFSQGRHDLFKIGLNDGEIINLTEDELYEKAPAVSPDGLSVAYTVRVDAYDKLFLSPLNNLKKKTQLMFGPGNTIAPSFSPDSKHVYFSGDMREAFNVYSLNLESGELRRWTDVRTGNFFPEPLPGKPDTIIFSSFNKGSFQMFRAELEPVVEKTVAFEEIAAEEEVRRFEPVIRLDIDKDKIKAHKGIGKLYVTSRPPVDAIVSTDGSIYGGSAISFSDILGDHSVLFMAYQVQGFRSYYFSYLNQRRRFQYMASAFQYTQYYYPPFYYFDSFGRDLYSYLTYKDAIATRKISGLSLAGYYPFNRFYRLEGGLGYYRYEEAFMDAGMLNDYGGQGYNYFLNGNLLSVSASLTGETTFFKEYGPAWGNTFRLALSQSVPISKSFLGNTTLQLDARQYLYIGGDTLFALRFEGFASRGEMPFVFYWGGNNQVRSSYFYNIVAHEGWFINAEFRFPLVNIASTIFGSIGPIRGVLFFDITRSKIKGYPAKFYEFSSDPPFPLLEYDAIGSYGYGIEFFLFGLPMHVEFARRLNFPRISHPFDFEKSGDFRTNFWIGFDF